MLDTMALLEKLHKSGLGRRSIDDKLFAADRVPARLGIYDEDEDFYHEEMKSACTIPGCVFTATSLLDFENHYNASHRYCCGECRRVLPSPHLLDLHIQETHDSFFAVLAARRPSYCCYIQECTNKFKDAQERLDHCIKVHKLPKDFRFEIKPKCIKPKKGKSQMAVGSMDVDIQTTGNCHHQEPHVFFHSRKYKGLTKYSGKKCTLDKTSKSPEMNIDEILSDLKEHLPE